MRVNRGLLDVNCIICRGGRKILILLKRNWSRPYLGCGFPVFLWKCGANLFWKDSKGNGKVDKIDINSEAIAKGLFARIYLVVEISKPLKMKVIYNEMVFLILV